MSYKKLDFDKNTLFLVTGGAGFIGSNLVEAILKLGCKVRCLDDLSTGKKNNIEEFFSDSSFEFIEGSICDEETCKAAACGADYVLHQAAWGSIPRSIKMPLKYDSINVHGTLNMLQASLDSGVKKFVYASSSSVYGDEKTLPKTEGREGKLLAPYPLTKAVNELYAGIYTSLYKLPTIGLRYFNVFGKKQDPYSTYAAVIPVFVKALLEGQSPTINGDGSYSRDFTYVENVIEANLKACLAGEDADGKVFNIAYGKKATLNELYDYISGLLDSGIRPIYGEPRKGDIPHSLADISSAKKLLGYDPQYSLAEGLKLAIEWYRSNL